MPLLFTAIYGGNGDKVCKNWSGLLMQHHTDIKLLFLRDEKRKKHLSCIYLVCVFFVGCLSLRYCFNFFFLFFCFFFLLLFTCSKKNQIKPFF